MSFIGKLIVSIQKMFIESYMQKIPEIEGLFDII